MNSNKNCLTIFLIGLFSATQIRLVGSIGISEIPIYLVAPFLFMNDYPKLRADGFLPVVWLSILTCLSCVASSLYNQTPMPLFLRGIATCYSIFAALVVFHHLLRGNILAYKWFLVGFSISMILNVFIFQQSVETFRLEASGSSLSKSEMIMSGELFWLNRIGPWLTLPTCCWYLQTPVWFSVLACMIMPIYTMFTTSTGRSATVVTLIGILMIAMGGRSIRKMKIVQKHLLIVAACMLCLTFAFKEVYQYLGRSGQLNEKAQSKFEMQMTQKKNSLLSLIMHGRANFFIGLMAACRRPILGYGPWAEDKEQIAGEFFSKYGSYDDVVAYYKDMKYRFERTGSYGLIASHSYIVGFWINYGFPAMFFWLYVCLLIYRLLRYNLSAVPQLFGFFSLSVFGSLWAILFSPYAARLHMPLFIVLMLFVDAIRRHKLIDPCQWRTE